ncbi:bis(5'-nucleosyl)-tetraphosphatase (symmetrical) YqeK [Clostridium sp. Marseille-P299]|uniref:bis(5'-nucleosyl)-tetraphosphatase (symmetrical) YqeK n=1 Tax=Clostridium sp. Marseille-P299 TaxID=1805477 RepID=UPI000ABA4953|nr:bis(5'-nucleosyl)-tetraphosphatase (symmetrical) YqeK [Clostridium sp. Marseille-P299]
MSLLSISALDEIQESVSSEIPKKRYYHTLSVAYLAVALAMCYGEDTSKAMAAGLLHDIAKYTTGEEAIRECREANLPVSEVEERNTFLLHSKLGAYYAEHKYGITDSDILAAISNHTTGRPNMSTLEKIVFLADYIEMRRNQPTTPSLAIIRETAFKQLDLAVFYALDNTLRYLSSTQREIDQLTVTTYEYYKKELNL